MCLIKRPPLKGASANSGRQEVVSLGTAVHHARDHFPPCVAPPAAHGGAQHPLGLQAVSLRTALQTAAPEECQAVLRGYNIARLSPERALVVINQRLDMVEA